MYRAQIRKVEKMEAEKDEVRLTQTYDEPRLNVEEALTLMHVLSYLVRRFTNFPSAPLASSIERSIKDLVMG